MEEKINPLHKIVMWGTGEASVFHITDCLEKYSQNPYNFTIEEFYANDRSKPTPEELDKLRQEHPAIERAYKDCMTRLIGNFHRISLTRKDVNVQYALAIAPLIDPAYKSWLLEYNSKQGATKAAALKDWMNYLESKDTD